MISYINDLDNFKNKIQIELDLLDENQKQELYENLNNDEIVNNLIDRLNLASDLESIHNKAFKINEMSSFKNLDKDQQFVFFESYTSVNSQSDLPTKAPDCRKNYNRTVERNAALLASAVVVCAVAGPTPVGAAIANIAADAAAKDTYYECAGQHGVSF